MPWVLWLIFGLCLIPELVLTGAELGLWGSAGLRDTAIDYFGFWPGNPDPNWPYYAGQTFLMFLSYGFLHAGLEHFGLNMLTLFVLGPPLARALGAAQFGLVYLILLVAGALGYALWPEPDVPMIGASGALFGLAGMLLTWEVQRRRARGLTMRPLVQNVMVVGLLNVALWWSMNGQIAWQTHLGGFLAGWLIAIRITPYRR